MTEADIKARRAALGDSIGASVSSLESHARETGAGLSGFSFGVQRLLYEIDGGLSPLEALKVAKQKMEVTDKFIPAPESPPETADALTLLRQAGNALSDCHGYRARGYVSNVDGFAVTLQRDGRSFFLACRETTNRSAKGET
jgi:hypothetical protein